MRLPYPYRRLLNSLLVSAALAACASTQDAAPVSENDPSPTLVPTVAVTPTIVQAVDAAPAATPQPEETSLPGEIVDQHGIRMRLVPAGEFTMGSEDGFHDEKPVHTVFLDAFYMDIYEVTNAAYAACVDAGACQPPRFTGSRQRYDYFGLPEYNNYPAVYLSWDDAYTYCTWRGARLPTEAEWEKAARGTDRRTYAWGDEKPNPTLTNYAGSNTWDTVEVGTRPAGVSPYGIHDMSGNVYEWVADWYGEYYYSISPAANPTGPAAGAWRITKGGSFWNWDYRLRIANRNNTYLPPDSVHWDGGARCARSP